MGGGKDGKGFATVVDANARNKIVYPGSFSDADFYSRQFGEIIETEIKQTKAYDTFAGFKGIFSDKVSESVASTRRARFTPEDIVFRPFGEITYCLIKNNSIQTPGVSKIQYIPRELNETLDQMVAEYNEEQLRKSMNKDNEEKNDSQKIENTNQIHAKPNNSIIIEDSDSADNPEAFFDIGKNDTEVVNENCNPTEFTYSEDNDEIDILGMLDDEEDL